MYAQEHMDVDTWSPATLGRGYSSALPVAQTQAHHLTPQPPPRMGWREGRLFSGLYFLLSGGHLSESELTHLNLTLQPCSPLQR